MESCGPVLEGRTTCREGEPPAGREDHLLGERIMWEEGEKSERITCWEEDYLGGGNHLQ